MELGRGQYSPFKQMGFARTSAEFKVKERMQGIASERTKIRPQVEEGASPGRGFLLQPLWPQGYHKLASQEDAYI
jgi:hypothetical protein